MKTIWKYSLSRYKEQYQMPQGAKILCVQMQHEEPQLWALVDKDAPKEPRTIAIYGTGHPMPDNPGVYLGMFQFITGLVFHVFEEV